ncbi:hypothetical protein [Geodermatophilus amargosae]|uniref:hypothetical protein n=1 Tax=Geodermatophilus amargosae TaxID=1296565 RepID=UPI0011147BFC|nr:hypothetical protein [Geodermatophilus amargosae]
MLAVVQHHERSRDLKGGDDRLFQGALRGVLDCQSVGHDPGHVARRGDGGKFNEPGATVEMDVGAPRRRHSEPCLADAARPQQQDHRRPRENTGAHTTHSLPANEWWDSTA